MIPYNEWKIVYEDSELDVRIDPQDLEGYGMNILNSENVLLFPRGTLREVALANRNEGKRIIENLMPIIEREERFFEGIKLNHDSIIAAATKAYWIEEKRFRHDREYIDRWNKLKMEKL